MYANAVRSKRESVFSRVGYPNVVFRSRACIMIRGLLKYVDGSPRQFGIRT